ncbi:hypothetical protein LP316_01080 [Thalassotalea sp. LPB0316]|uniref:FlgO family outer membrane protein n=1 Tax=Thalassotalea sp. LPB0316 TaxID=2769490 RepID=UPI0018688D4A|nr:FlgO family outer membrane protein [Thalassotalea sp. LPB0316]QOL25940.1 hypothetical protein LP316_01080 [Thalassotalea sp. LPB0316]
MRILISIVVLTGLVSCTSLEGNQDDYSYFDQKANDNSTSTIEQTIDQDELPSHQLNTIVAGLTEQMLEKSSFVTASTPVAVASFVNLSDLESTNWLGNQLAESFMHHLQQNGLIVVDFKSTGFFRVTPEGDFVFSRNYEELSQRQIIDYVVTGTMVEQANGYIVNARMIGMMSHVVVASSQTFIPRWAMGKEVDMQQKVVKDGITILPTDQYDESRWVKIEQ